MAEKRKKETKKGKSATAEKVENRSIARAISTRGRVFQGVVIRKFPLRATIEFGRTVKIPKYERFMKKTTRIHARLPNEMSHNIHVGDLIRVQECRPLSKIIHHIVIEKVKSGENGGKSNE